MTTAPMRQWIGYDWFKLIVAIILVLLLLSFWLGGVGTPAAQVVPAAAPRRNRCASCCTRRTVAPAATVAPRCRACCTRRNGRARCAVATISAPTLNVPTGALAPGAITFNGTAAPNAAIQVLVDGQPIGTAKADASGAWSLDATLETPGDHQIVAQALDDQGAVAAAAAPVSITLGRACCRRSPRRR